MKQNADSRHPFLVALGERVRSLRAEHSLTRKQLAVIAKVSERHLANLESGTGNVSVLILVDLAKAFQLEVIDLMHSSGATSAKQGLRNSHWEGLNGVGGLPTSAAGAHSALSTQSIGRAAQSRIALIGLRGAGKSTLGAMLAKELGYGFVETSREIEALAGSSLAEIYNLYGEAGYRRYERQALKQIVTQKEPVVIATPGGVVADADTFELLLRHCQVVWLQAKPLDHLARVRAQGDNRPMAATRTTQRAAIDDLKSILAAREPMYAMAHHTLDTSGLDERACLRELKALVS
jgi:XRE family transcriptional regulator, aerobic/anaerobic benzoate catabolism transcriptional regulator